MMLFKLYPVATYLYYCSIVLCVYLLLLLWSVYQIIIIIIIIIQHSGLLANIRFACVPTISSFTQGSTNTQVLNLCVTLSLGDNYKIISIQSCSVGHQHIPILALRSGMFFNNSHVAHQLHWLRACVLPTYFVDHLFPHCGPRSCRPLWLEIHAYLQHHSAVQPNTQACVPSTYPNPNPFIPLLRLWWRARLQYHGVPQASINLFPTLWWHACLQYHSAPLARAHASVTVNADHYCTGLQCADITWLTRVGRSQQEQGGAGAGE